MAEDGRPSTRSALRASGAVGAIGAGVNSCRPCERLLAIADPDLFLLAGRYTLLDQTAIAALLPACEARGVGVLLGGPFNSGILATGPRPGARFDYAPASEAIRKKAAALAAIAGSHGVALADAALQFPLAHPTIVGVIAGARSRIEVERAATGIMRSLPAAFWADLRASGLIGEDVPLPEAQPC